MYPCGKFGKATTAAARAALPVPNNVCGTQLIAVFNGHTDVDACDCTRDFTERTPERESALKVDFTVRKPKADFIVRTPEETLH